MSQTSQSVNHDARALADIARAYLAFKPPRRIPVSQGAAENLFIRQPGGVPGNWSAVETPYMVEPMDMLASRKHEAVVFAGPARSGKTAGMLLGWMAHTVMNDPGDMLFIQMTQDKAREFSKTEIDRALRYSESLRAMMGGSHDDTIHDKMFRHGMYLKIGWPTNSNVSGSTYRYVAITDLDRMANAEDVDGEGPLFSLALKRTQTFLSRGMCLVESSPGIEITDANWKAATRHEAPPVLGVLGIYNRSDRRRWYWQCILCDEWFEAAPGLSLFNLPAEDTLLEVVREADLEQIATEHNRIRCPHCHGFIGPRSKGDLNSKGRWLQDGLILNRDGTVDGQAHESTIAGYWLGGVAATYQSWRSIILRYLQGLRSLVLTNSEEALKTATNTDQGMPYMSRSLRNIALSSHDPEVRKEGNLERFVVPDSARFIVASVDIQGGAHARFVVQVTAVGAHGEKWPIDRYNIIESTRDDGSGNKAPINPAAYAEDWDLITERVVRSTYRTTIANVELRVLLTVVDSGGEDGVTERAYAWYRRTARAGMARRVMLVKGQDRNKFERNTPPIKETLVGNRTPGERGDVVLYLLNSDRLKDIVANGLRRTTPGPGFTHLPSWLPKSFFDELKAEVRNKDGTWSQVRVRNEAFDLFCYCEAGCLRLGIDHIDWNKPPPWAATIALNSECYSKDERQEMKSNEIVVSQSATQQPLDRVVPTARRVARSKYLS